VGKRQLAMGTQIGSIEQIYSSCKCDSKEMCKVAQNICNQRNKRTPNSGKPAADGKPVHSQWSTIRTQMGVPTSYKSLARIKGGASLNCRPRGAG
jgi:hypothetical protein